MDICSLIDCRVIGRVCYRTWDRRYLPAAQKTTIFTRGIISMLHPVNLWHILTLWIAIFNDL